MAGSSAPVLFQRMSLEAILNPSDPPVIGIFQDAPFVEEGATASFTIRRTGGSHSAVVTYTVLWQSAAGDGDFVGPTTVVGQLGAGVTEMATAIQTVRRAGTQNTRQITCTITAVDTGFISPTNEFAVMNIIDFIDTGTKWWKQLPYRSGRRWAGGVSYNAFPDQNYEQTVSYIDGFGASKFGANKTRVQTWQRVAGGPLNNPSVIDSASQFNWTEGTSDREYTRLINMKSLVNKVWAVWVCELIPKDMTSDESEVGGNRNTAFDYVNAGSADQWYLDFGARLRLQLEARGWDLRWWMGRPFHELQQTNYYRVYPDTKAKFVSAYDRAIDKIREGGDFNFRFMFAPGQEKTYDGNAYGRLKTWTPTNVDFLSVSWHPGPATNSRATYLANMINGTNKWYGMEGDVWSDAVDLGIPIGFCEWSPHYEATQGCPIADDCYAWFHDEFLVPHADDVVVDLLYDQTALQKGIYANPNHPDGPAHWDNGVDVFAAKWKGKGPNWPDYVPV